MTTYFAWLAPAVALSLPLLAHAQTPGDPAGKAPAQQLRYQSAFSDYKSWQDLKRGDWRQLNDNVRPAPNGANGQRHMHHGGHGHGHMQHGAHAPSASVAPASAPVPAHRGHPMHGGKP